MFVKRNAATKCKVCGGCRKQKTMMADHNTVTIKIKKIKKPIKTRKKSESCDSDPEKEVKEEDEDEDISLKLEEMKTLQKLRQRPNGVNALGLALGTKTIREEEDDGTGDLFRSKSGGMVNMKILKSGKVKQTDDAYDTGIGTQFSAETNKRDEDEEMMKYIEEQLTKKKGSSKGIVREEDSKEKAVLGREAKYRSPEEAALQAVPDHLRISSTRRSEEMLSNQMLSGIPEVDLGIDAKIRNIEATEEAKLKLLWNKRNKNEGPSQFVPSNITVNFAQQNKIHVEDSEILKKEPMKPIRKLSVMPMDEDNKMTQKRKDGEKATDDYHYEKFKKQFRRY